jgi:uncharacterized protein YkwD
MRTATAAFLAAAILMGTAVTASAATQDDSAEIAAMTEWLNGLTVTLQQPDSADPTGNTLEPAKMLTAEELDAYAGKVHELINAEREAAGAAALEYREDVAEAAQIRAKELVTQYTHDRPDGGRFFTVLDDCGIERAASGENIYSSPYTPESAVEGWMASDGHRATLLKDKYTATGVGVYQSENGTLHWVQLFIKE